MTPVARGLARSSCRRLGRFQRKEDAGDVSAEVWKLVAVLVFFAIVLAASYWFVILPDPVTRRLDKPGQDRVKDTRRMNGKRFTSGDPHTATSGPSRHWRYTTTVRGRCRTRAVPVFGDLETAGVSLVAPTRPRDTQRRALRAC